MFFLHAFAFVLHMVHSIMDFQRGEYILASADLSVAVLAMIEWRRHIKGPAHSRRC